MSVKTESSMRRFTLLREEDETGTSGTGLVAEGVEFTSGWCALTWLTPYGCVTFYENLKVLDHLHGHHGKTHVVFLDPPEGA